MQIRGRETRDASVATSSSHAQRGRAEVLEEQRGITHREQSSPQERKSNFRSQDKNTSEHEEEGHDAHKQAHAGCVYRLQRHRLHPTHDVRAIRATQLVNTHRVRVYELGCDSKPEEGRDSDEAA